MLADTAAAVTHAEQEMIHRRRLVDTLAVETIAELNARTDHAEYQPDHLLLIEAHPGYTARISAVAAHRAALRLHTVILGTLDGFPAIQVAIDGTPTARSDPADAGAADGSDPPLVRLATNTAPTPSDAPCGYWKTG